MVERLLWEHEAASSILATETISIFLRGLSSVGRAGVLQAPGHRFEADSSPPIATIAQRTERSVPTAQVPSLTLGSRAKSLNLPR